MFDYAVADVVYLRIGSLFEFTLEEFNLLIGQAIRCFARNSYFTHKSS
jgi:hypothetical protein